jgi:HNH endonuclease
MAVPETLSQAVRLRADGRCQYCLMHESLQGATFHVEHIIPQSKGGHSVLENLALACPGCNLHKADRTTAVDPATGEQVPLFHPIRQRWSEHEMPRFLARMVAAFLRSRDLPCFSLESRNWRSAVQGSRE